MLGEKRLIQSIKLPNLLSFGPEAEEIELKSLNVLIEPHSCEFRGHITYMEFDPSRSDNKEQEGGFFEMNEDRLFSPKLPNNNICFEKYVPERNGVGYEWLGETIGAAN